jgi:nuclear transcription factor Y gamma
MSQSFFRYDQFDFLIDIVPREDMKPAANKSGRDDLMNSGVITSGSMVAGSSNQSVRMVPDQVTYYFQQQQQQHQSVVQPTANTLQPQIIQLQVMPNNINQTYIYLKLDSNSCFLELNNQKKLLLNFL